MIFKKSHIKNHMLKVIIPGLVFFPLAFSNADSNICSTYLTLNQSNVSIDRIHYLSLYFGSIDFGKLKDSEVRLMVEKIEASLSENPNDLNLLNVYWFTTDLLDSEKRNLKIKNKRLEVIKKLDTLMGSTETIKYRYFLAYFDLKDFQQALEYILLLKSNYPDNFMYSLDLVRTNLRLHDYNGAINLAETMLLKNPDNLALLRLISEAYIRMASSINSDSSSNISLKKTLFVKAETYLRRFLFEQGQASARYQIYFVRALLGQNTITKSKEALDYLNYITIKSDKKLIQVYTVYAYVGLRNFEDAYRISNELVNADSKNIFYKSLKNWVIKSSNNLNGASDQMDLNSFELEER